jgi:ActR/RegA family two-component response regulator
MFWGTLMTEPQEFDSQAPQRLRVFISYARSDGSDFAEYLVVALKLLGFDAYIDRHDIAKAEDWEARLGELIARSDTTVFIITPASIKSPRCDWEIKRTVTMGKRLVPVQWIPVPEPEVPAALKRLNYTIFKTGEPFSGPIAELGETLRQDLGWLRQQTQLQEEAQRWQASQRDPDLLLRGRTLIEARDWTLRRKPNAPEISAMLNAFIGASDEAEMQRSSAERLRLEEIAKAQKEREAALDAEKAALKAAQTAQTRTLRLQRQRVQLAMLAVFISAILGGVALAKWREAENGLRKTNAAFQLAREFTKLGVPWELAGMLKAASTFDAISLDQVRILWVDGDPGNNVGERRIMEKLGAKIACARDSESGLKYLDRNKVNLIIANFHREKDTCSGLCFVEKVVPLASSEKNKIIIYTGSCDQSKRDEAIKVGAFEETNSPDHLLEAVVRATRPAEEAKKIESRSSEELCSVTPRAASAASSKFETSSCSLTNDSVLAELAPSSLGSH